MTVPELLQAWRDAIRAAELAERMTTAAVRAADDADLRASAAHEIAALAGQAAEYAARAGERAAAAAIEAAALAKELREQGMPSAETTRSTAREDETQAAARYHRAEAEATEAG